MITPSNLSVRCKAGWGRAPLGLGPPGLRGCGTPGKARGNRHTFTHNLIDGHTTGVPTHPRASAPRGARRTTTTVRCKVRVCRQSEWSCPQRESCRSSVSICLQVRLHGTITPDSVAPRPASRRLLGEGNSNRQATISNRRRQGTRAPIDKLKRTTLRGSSASLASTGMMWWNPAGHASP